MRYRVNMRTKNHIIINSDYVDLTQAAREGPFAKRTLWTLIAEGRLGAYRPLRRKILIRRSEITRIVESSRVSASSSRRVDDVVEAAPR